MQINEDLSIVLCGEAGQGIQTIEAALITILQDAGLYIFATKEYMSRVRGGCNSTEIRIASKKIAAYVDRIDILISLSNQAISHLQKKITPQTLIFGNKTSASNAKIIDVNFKEMAKGFGAIYESAVSLGLILALLNIEQNYFENYFAKRFAAKPQDIVANNIAAAHKGYSLGIEILAAENIKIQIIKNAAVKNEKIFNGAKAIALGAIAGGCNFIASYPMSPGTGVLNELAALSHEFDIVVEQAEDEIAAINMGLGAWYAGARALVTTSGGGFALMCETLSLAGITEMPMVIHLGQRPGPATGLPTRTEQGDLNLVLYAGHGEFPRIIFAPGTLEEASSVTQKAFYFADKYQVPVILLTDQYFIDSYYLVEPFDPTVFTKDKNFFEQTAKDYKRYQLKASGLSPRGIPQFGEGIVCVDSDEHTEEGYITEDFDVRIKMVDKRFKKMEEFYSEAIAPTLLGNENSENLVVCWGSNFHLARETLEKIDNSNIALLHFSQVYPLLPEWNSYFARAKRIIVIENNKQGQFAQLLKRELNVTVDININKYNGLPFSIEEILTYVAKNVT